MTFRNQIGLVVIALLVMVPMSLLAVPQQICCASESGCPMADSSMSASCEWASGSVDAADCCKGNPTDDSLAPSSASALQRLSLDASVTPTAAALDIGAPVDGTDAPFFRTPPPPKIPLYTLFSILLL